MATLYEKVLAYQQPAEPDRRNGRDQRANPVGVQSRNLRHKRIYSTGWHARASTLEGIRRTVPWIEAQVQAARAA